MTEPSIPSSTALKPGINGHYALPSNSKGPALLLLHEIYGLHDDLRTLADTYAAEGFVVWVPDLFYRREGARVFAYEHREQALQAIQKDGGVPPLIEGVVSAFDELARQPQVQGARPAVVGIGFGGLLGYAAAAEGWVKPQAGIAYYPGRLDLSKASALDQPWQFHFGNRDSVVQPPDLGAQTRSAFGERADVGVHFYDELHGFALRTRTEFGRESAAQALRRDVDFLRQLYSREKEAAAS